MKETQKGLDDKLLDETMSKQFKKVGLQYSANILYGNALNQRKLKEIVKYLYSVIIENDPSIGEEGAMEKAIEIVIKAIKTETINNFLQILNKIK